MIVMNLNHSFQYKSSPVKENVTACVVVNYPILGKSVLQSVCEDVNVCRHL